MDTILTILSNLIHHYVWVGRHSLYSDLALGDFTKLNLGAWSTLNFDARPFNIVYSATQHLRFTVDTLQVNAGETALGYAAILNDATIVSLADNMKSTLLEIDEAGVWHLDIGVYSDAARSVISFITKEFATDQVDRCLREAHDSRKLLIESIRDRFECQCTFTKNDTAWVETNNGIHVSWYFEFGQSFNAWFNSMLNIQLSLQNIFS